MISASGLDLVAFTMISYLKQLLLCGLQGFIQRGICAQPESSVQDSLIYKATIPSLFLRFVFILKYYVLENITALISKKCPYL